MKTRFTKPTALGLAALYTLLAACGHGLHTHGTCRPSWSDASSGVATSCECSCGRSHATIAEDGADSRQQWRSGKPGAAGHDCAACSVLRQLSVGYATQLAVSLQHRGAADVAVAYDAPAASTEFEAWSPRGPPCPLSA